LHCLADQLARLALAERLLAEAGEAFLIAQVRRQALVGGLALGEIARVDHQNRAIGRVVDGATSFDRKRAAILAPISGDRGIGALDARYQVLELALQDLVRPVDTDFARHAAQQLCARVAELVTGGVVEVDELALPDVDQQHHVGGGVERGAEAPQRCFGLLAAHYAFAQRKPQTFGCARR
jgi:hypothetical protein